VSVAGELGVEGVAVSLSPSFTYRTRPLIVFCSTRGNVIYKSVGLGLMDIVVGNELLRVGKEKNIGLTVENF
jgi:hypothetical protein